MLTTTPPALELAGITKAFQGVRALDAVTFTVDRGEVVGLVGENGAGKSTLLKVLSGDHHSDAGEIRLGGHPHRFRSPAHARRSGIRVIYQEPELVGTLTVVENLFLGETGTGGRLVRWSRLRRAAAELIDRYGFAGQLPVHATVERLTPAQRQLVEIVKALRSDPAILALDEPTSALSEQEVARVLDTVRRLRAAGVGIIYVSHRLHEVTQLADRVVVLRDGRLVAERAAADVDENELIRLMVGRPLGGVFRPAGRRPAGEVRLAVDGLCAPGLRDVSLTVRAGEIVGLAGLVGAGRTELARALYGDLQRTAGTVRVDGRPVALRDPRAAIAAGIAMTPEDRHHHGLVRTRPVRENLTLAMLRRLRRLRFVRRRAERVAAAELMHALRVKAPSPEHPVTALSGGNQQKVVLGRALSTEPRVLILDEPTRGVDVGAKAEIYRLIYEQVDRGMAVLVISSELPEVLGLADRILVMAGGRIAGELPAATATEDAVLTLAMPHMERT